jgi:double zinc ribbon protein
VFCAHCGKENPGQAAYCFSCGGPLPADSPHAPGEVPAAPPIATSTPAAIPAPIAIPAPAATASSVAPAAHVAASKRCPACGLPNRKNAEQCGCGHSFISPAEGAAVPVSVVAQQAPPHTLQRPTGVTVLAVLEFIGAAMCVLAGVVGIGTGLEGDTSGAGVAAFVGVVFLALGGLQVVCGIGLWKLKPYGRTIQLVLSWIGLLAIPLGTTFQSSFCGICSSPG